MKKMNQLLVIGLLIGTGMLLYFSKTELFAFLTKKEGGKTAASQQGTGLQGNETKALLENKPQEKPMVQEVPVVEIPSDKLQMLGVKTVEAVSRPFAKTIRSVGRVEYDERRTATVNTKFEGWIEKLYLDYTGRPVKKGEPLAEVYSPELLATQQELINAVRWAGQKRAVKDEAVSNMFVRDAEAVIEAARQRLRLWDISDSTIRKIEESGKPVRTVTLFSPVNGFVVQKMAVQGMRVMPGEKLFDIADLSSVWVISDIFESDLSFIKEGQTAAISLSNIPGKVFSSRIEYVYPAVSGDTRTAKVRFTLPNAGGLLKPQMFANVEVKINLGNKLLLPSDAVIETGLRQIVYVDKGEGNFEPREVQTGIKADGMVEIIKGIKAGEKIASAANFLIDSEAQLKGIKPLSGNNP